LIFITQVCENSINQRENKTLYRRANYSNCEICRWLWGVSSPLCIETI